MPASYCSRDAAAGNLLSCAFSTVRIPFCSDWEGRNANAMIAADQRFVVEFSRDVIVIHGAFEASA